MVYFISKSFTCNFKMIDGQLNISIYEKRDDFYLCLSLTVLKSEKWVRYALSGGGVISLLLCD